MGLGNCGRTLVFILSATGSHGGSFNRKLCNQGCGIVWRSNNEGRGVIWKVILLIQVEVMVDGKDHGKKDINTRYIKKKSKPIRLETRLDERGI